MKRCESDQSNQIQTEKSFVNMEIKEVIETELKEENDTEAQVVKKKEKKSTKDVEENCEVCEENEDSDKEEGDEADDKDSSKDPEVPPEEYEVEYIVNKRVVDVEGKDTVQYLVKWKGWENICDRTWEPVEHLEDVPELVEEFEKREVETIVDKRLMMGKIEYLVKWKGWDNYGDKTWETTDKLAKVSDLVDRFDVEFEVKEEERDVGRKKRTSVTFLQLNEEEETPKKKKKTEDDEEEYEVEHILDKRLLPGGRVEYLVKWKGWENLEDRTWEPLGHLEEVSDLVEEFEKNEKANNLSRKSL